MPTFVVSDPYISPDNPGVSILQAPFTLKINALTNYSIFSPSYFALGIHQLTAEVALKDLVGNIIPGALGTSSISNLRFPARSTANYTVVFSKSNLSLLYLPMLRPTLQPVLWPKIHLF